MGKLIVLDASPLSLLCHPDHRKPQVAAINLWVDGRLEAGDQIFIPEIADYEVRRELLRAGKQRSVRRLDALAEVFTYLPLDTAIVRRACEMWAGIRNSGLPVSPPEALDADVLLAATAEAVGGIIATENVAHLARLGSAAHWRDIR